MLTSQRSREARLLRLLEASKLLAEASSPAGQRLRERLLETTRLSAQGIELGLERCLERSASAAERDALLASVPEAPRAHVLLSANVFVGALRALALALVASPRVLARASRRESALAEALHELVPELFQLVPELRPEPGEHVWAYGSDATLHDLRRTLPRGVCFHGHGHGFGAIAIEARPGRDVAAEARAIALDTALFDQRGCLSPRLVTIAGGEQDAAELSEALALSLRELAEQVPPGPASDAERAEERRFRDAALYAFELLDAGGGSVSLSQTSHLAIPPAGRHLHVARVSDPPSALLPFAPHLTCIGVSGSASFQRALAATFPAARLCALGEMQRPPLDGPVDRRAPSAGELL